MNQQTRHKTRLMTLTEKTSSKGTRYLFGFLGDAEVIGFRGDPNQWGETWTLFVQEKAQKAIQHSGQQRPSRVDQQSADLFQRPLSRDRG